MTTTSSDSGKTTGIIAYLSLIGWIIALVMNNNDKSEFASFHIRQMLGIMIVGVALSIVASILGIGVLWWVIRVAMLVLWLLGFIGAVQGERKVVPVLGDQFQQWFKGIG